MRDISPGTHPGPLSVIRPAILYVRIESTTNPSTKLPPTSGSCLTAQENLGRIPLHLKDTTRAIHQIMRIAECKLIPPYTIVIISNSSHSILTVYNQFSINH